MEVRLWLCTLVLGISSLASAAPQATTLHDFHHTAWTQKDGAPAGIWTIAQTLDGWLWLGTASGLYRFDGISFEHHDLLPRESTASRSISVIFASRSGDLWASYSFGGTSVRRASGQVEHMLPGGLPLGVPVENFEEDGTGRIWAETPQGLYSFEQGRWQPAAPRWGIPKSATNSLTRDAEGGLWLVGEAGPFLLKKGADHFERVELDLPSDIDLSLAADGRLWVRSGTPVRPLVSEHLPEPPALPGPTRTGAGARARMPSTRRATSGMSSVGREASAACPSPLPTAPRPRARRLPTASPRRMASPRTPR